MRKYLVVVLLLVGVISCNNITNNDPVKFDGLAQGTYYSITYFDKQQRNFNYEIDSILKAFDLTASIYHPESVISQINSNETVCTNQDFKDIFLKGMEVSAASNGAFDMTVMPLVNAWGFGFKNKEKVDESLIDSLLQFVGYSKVQLVDGAIEKENAGVMIDFNSIAQGYSVDLVGEFLSQKGIENFLVDIGGEVLAKGSKPGLGLWKVGVEKPSLESNSPRVIKAVVSLKDRAIATSGTYRKYYEKDGVRFSHTIDPKTGYPVQHSMLSATVLAKNACEADAYATAFMVMGLEKSKAFLKDHDDMDGYFIFSNEQGKLRSYATPGMRRFIDTED